MAWEMGGQATFTLRIKALQNGPIREMLRFSNEITSAEAYPLRTPQAKSRLALRFGNSTNAFDLFQNQPNPFAQKTSISFQLPEASDAVLKVMDGTGKILWIKSGNWAKGLNTQEIDLSGISDAGVLYYVLETATQRAVRKMIRI